MDPLRFYLLADNAAGDRHFAVHRTDDDGATWGEVLRFTLGSDPEPSWIDRILYDPSAPNQIYARLCCPGTRWLASLDGGAEWAEVDLGPVNDFVMLDDGLYVATDEGLWRVGLQARREPPSTEAIVATVTGSPENGQVAVTGEHTGWAFDHTQQTHAA